MSRAGTFARHAYAPPGASAPLAAVAAPRGLAKVPALHSSGKVSGKKIQGFRSVVWRYWKEHGRHDLPWRRTKDPYRILVSEVMLQQTQVDRVIPFYEKFLSEFPDVEHLASSSLRSVLICWSGLGYNRRAKYLHETAKKLAGRKLSVRDLESPLPGVGPYTRDAVLALAFNEPRALVETNIRSVFIHHFFPHTRNISDREICAYAKMAAEGQDPRMWHWALMDYGAYLKKLYKNPSRRSAHYTKQSKFEGSLRQVRGAILRELHTGPKTNLKICSLIHAHMEYHTPSSFGRNENKLSFRTLASRHRRIVAMALASLAHDTLIVRERGKWRIA